MEKYELKLAASKDCQLYFKWANDELTRQNSFNQEKITFEDHKEWFYKKIFDQIFGKSTAMYIFEVDDIPVGQVRIDGNVLSYSVAKEYRNRGYGTKMIKIVSDLYDDLYAEVKLENLYSVNILKKAGFTCVQLPGHNYWSCTKVTKEII